ncbi:MAG: response regulator transcription factor [Armatimonadetes bacterium]|nr:response regulator transcription factor [Armatimonadota bacterium]
MLKQPMILAVDDDPFLLKQISGLLNVSGFGTEAVNTGEKALLYMRANAPDLVIVDLGLPDFDGTTLARLIRAQSAVPILMLTARARAADKVLGFEMGADDYVTKPFEPTDLGARVRALLRRAKPVEVATASVEKHVLGNLSVDEASRRVGVGESALNLTSREFDLLLYFFKNRDRALSREQIFEQVWGYDIEFSSNILDVIVYRLRNKISVTGGPDAIKTIRGFGYSFGCE